MVKNLIADLLENNILRHTAGPLADQPSCRDGFLRLCIDYWTFHFRACSEIIQTCSIIKHFLNKEIKTWLHVASTKALS